MTKLCIEIAGGMVQSVQATSPVSIQFVDHDCFDDEHMEVVTWVEEIPQSDCITDEQFALGLA